MRTLLLGLLGSWVMGGVSFAAPVELDDHPLGPGIPGMSIGLGAGVQHTKLGWDTGPQLSLRYDFARKGSEGIGPEDLSPWSLEFGAILPHAGPGDITDTVAGQPFHAKLRRFSEEYLALRYRWAVRRPVR